MASYLLRISHFLFLLCSLTNLNAQLSELEIWQIQGDGLFSPYEDSIVVAPANIVTFVTNDRFFIQTPPNRSDNNPLTSDGLMVYVGDETGLEIGDLVTVTGSIQEYFGLTEFGPDNLTYVVDSSNVELPEAIQLNDTFPSTEIQPFPDLEKIEGMRVAFENGLVTGPSNNQMAAFSLQNTRSFREPGIIYPGINNLPVWDGNPEVLQFNHRWSGSLPLSAGMSLSGTGVLTAFDGRYEIISNDFELDGENILLSVRNKTQTEATVGSLNCYVFSILEPDFTIRKFKIANYIINQLKAPDILAVQEVRNLATLEALAVEINSINPDIAYDAYLELGPNSGNFQINNGFLVRNNIQDVVISQWAEDEQLSLGGFLHDRPPLLLEGSFAIIPPTPVKVLNLHLRSLGGIEGSNADYVRTKRWEQSISVANIIRDLQFQNLIVVGDYNAFQFSDGYVDVLAQLTGEESLGSEYPVLDIVDPPLTNHSANIEETEQYSFVFRGNAQILDHCISTDLVDLTINDLQYARGNSDNSDDYVDDSFVPYRASDHDGFVLFLGLNDTISTSNNDLVRNEIKVKFANPFTTGSVINIEMERTELVRMELYDNSGKLLVNKNLNLSTGQHTLYPEWDLSSGMYFLHMKGEGISITKKLVFE